MSDPYFKKLRIVNSYRRRFADNVDFSKYELRLATTYDEMIKSCKLLYKSHHAMGLVEKNKNAIAIMPQMFLCDTATYIIIEKATQKVLATLSTMNKNLIGLPIETILNLDNAVQAGRTISEIGYLAVANPKMDHIILDQLILKAVQWGESYGVDDLYYSIHPNHINYFSSICCASELESIYRRTHGLDEKAPWIVIRSNFSDAALERAIPHITTANNYMFYYQQRRPNQELMAPNFRFLSPFCKSSAIKRLHEAGFLPAHYHENRTRIRRHNKRVVKRMSTLANTFEYTGAFKNPDYKALTIDDRGVRSGQEIAIIDCGTLCLVRNLENPLRLAFTIEHLTTKETQILKPVLANKDTLLCRKIAADETSTTSYEDAIDSAS